MNAILTVSDVRGYIPTLTTAVLSDPILQDYIDNMMALINESLGLDLSGGIGVAVTQTFRWENYPQRVLRLAVPTDTTAPFVVTEGNPPATVAAANYVAYSNMITRHPGYSSLYWFDRNTPLTYGFLPPVAVTYTPRADVFRVIKQLMLNLIRINMMRFDPVGGGNQAFSFVTEEVDDGQSTQWSPVSDADIGNAIADEIAKIRLLWQGPRIG